jgi:hypothetical protein
MIYYVINLKRFILFLSFVFVSACATRYSPQENYKEHLASLPPTKTKSTTVLFLVDGLSTRVLEQAQKKGRVPRIAHHFLSDGNKINHARAIFPSLTYPNVASLLKMAPVHETGALGNSVVVDGRLLSFENPDHRIYFSHQMRGENIFTRLKEKGLRSVSLDYGLAADADVSAETFDIKTGIAIRLENHIYLDEKKLESLKLLLSQHPPAQWPEFIFVHLIGLDFISHQYGADSKQAHEYLQNLDRFLEPVFWSIRRAERDGHHVDSILTADHGFNRDIKSYVPIKKTVSKLNQDLRVLNEGRMASVYSAIPLTENDLSEWTRNLLTTRGIEIVAFRLNNVIQLRSKTQSVKISYVSTLACDNGSIGISINAAAAICSNHLSPDWKNQFYPDFIENISSFFAAKKYPDLVIIPNSTTAFSNAYRGFHGGPTAEETIVPLLLRNVKLTDPEATPAIWNLLNFLLPASRGL